MQANAPLQPSRRSADGSGVESVSGARGGARKRRAFLLAAALFSPVPAASAVAAETESEKQPPAAAKVSPPAASATAKSAPKTAAKTSPKKPDAGATAELEGISEIRDNNLVIAKNPDGAPAVLTVGAWRLEAPEIRFDRRAGRALFVGDTFINHAVPKLPLRILAESPTVGFTAGAFSLDSRRFRLGAWPGFVAGDAFKGERNAPLQPAKPAATGTGTASATGTGSAASVTAGVTLSRASLENVTVYYLEPDFFSLSVSASKAVLELEQPAKSKSVKLEEISLHIEDAVVRVASVPVLYLPSLTLHGLENPPIRPIWRAGQKNSIGAFLSTTTYYTGYGKAFEPGLLLDGYTKAGALVGPALDYKGANYAGSLQGGWIRDNSLRNSKVGLDTFGRPIDPQRGFFLWAHKQTVPFSGTAGVSVPAAGAAAAFVPRALEISAQVNYWSDTSVLRDFRRENFDLDQRPDNFVELVAPAPAYYLSALVRFNPNEFQNIQQRLPEVRFDLNPRPILNTGVYQRLNLSLAYLYEHNSPELPIHETTAAGAGYSYNEALRFDGYYGLTRPVKIGDFLAFTPVAGARVTTWLDTPRNNQSDTALTRVLPQLGFDLHLDATGAWNYRNDFWEINGLRHRLRPLVQYRWIPAADKYAGDIPAIDRQAFVTYPPPIDLAQKRYTDDLWEQQVLRVGVENTLQTRHPEYGSRDLLWLNVYQDFRDNTAERAGERVRSSLYTQFGIAPAWWLSLDVYNRMDTYAGDAREVSARLEIHDGDKWRLWFGAQYSTDVRDTNQYLWGVEYRLNSNYALTAHWRFDSDSNRLVTQYYGLRQRLGNTWILEWHVAYRRDARRDDGISAGVNVRMVGF
ncbi:MAG: LPS-assembly protein LptD [Puniceicoccales bacterium]|jgi:LPS-assembly protein|nr:LPS-assembly protein LptD [Puniceicoccales bacterium]